MASAISGSDSVTINMPDLRIAESHSGTLADGGNGTFSISVSNVASGSTAGPSGGAITVTDTLPAQFTFISAVAAGWSCGAVGQAVTCTNPGPINPGAAAATIPLLVAISSSASGAIANTATVASFGDSNTANNSATDSVTFAPDLTISESPSGKFGAGTDGAFSLAVNNLGNGLTTGAITITDTLPPQFTFISANAAGWTCGAASQLVTCTNPGPIAAGASAATIPMIVAVSSSAVTAPVANTATVSTVGDSNAANDSATANISVVGPIDLPESISINVPGGGAGGIIYAGGNSVTIALTVTNEGNGDILTPALSLNGVACSTCGTLGSVVAGTPGNYTLAYTPPASLAATTNVTLTVTSNLANAFPATGNFNVYPAGMRVVKMTGIGGGPGPKTGAARVFNDPGNPGLTLQLLGAGYACPPAGGGTICGTLALNNTISGTTTAGMGTSNIPFTLVNFTYTPPATVANSPYDRPMIMAVSKADSTQRGAVNFMLFPNGVAGGIIGNGSRLSSALTGSAPITIGGGVGNDMGVNKTIAWSLTVNGVDCQPACGTLSAPTYTLNGSGVNATLTYTPPATVPLSPANQPVLTAMPVDVINGIQQSDSVQFNINDGTCGTGNESILSGQYAFLLKGGAAGQGYVATIGSFTADGGGHITGGLLDINRTVGASIGLSIVAAGSSYSIGPDNRGCLTLANSAGGQATYRFAVGNLDGSGHATQGRIVRFDDNTGFGQRVQGFLMRQDPTAFASSANGNYVFGYEGVQNAGARLAVVGLYHADGAGNLTNFNSDAVDGSGNVDSNDPNGSGTYAIDPATGRGTGTVTTGGTSNTVLYVVNASEILSMTTDAMGPSTPIVSGENRKQAATPFAPTSLDNNAYVFYETAVDTANGGNTVSVGQVQFTTNGAYTGELDVNDSGTPTTQAISDAFATSSNGRATNVSGSAVLYLIGTDSAVVLNADNSVPFGYLQQQTGIPFTDASLSGLAFFSGGAATAGASFDVGSATFDGAGGLTINDDQQDPESGLKSESLNLSYAVVPTTGKLTISSPTDGVIVTGFVISSSKIAFIQAFKGRSSPQLFVGAH